MIFQETKKAYSQHSRLLNLVTAGEWDWDKGKGFRFLFYILLYCLIFKKIKSTHYL